LSEGLTSPFLCSQFVHMPVTTLGEAWKLGWRVRVRCLWLAAGKLLGTCGKTEIRTIFLNQPCKVYRTEYCCRLQSEGA
jgi:hypothetical protein